jgi:hypothetical protein
VSSSFGSGTMLWSCSGLAATIAPSSSWSNGVKSWSPCGPITSSWKSVLSAGSGVSGLPPLGAVERRMAI